MLLFRTENVRKSMQCSPAIGDVLLGPVEVGLCLARATGNRPELPRRLAKKGNETLETRSCRGVGVLRTSRVRAVVLLPGRPDVGGDLMLEQTRGAPGSGKELRRRANGILKPDDSSRRRLAIN